MGLKTAKNVPKLPMSAIFGTFFAVFRPLRCIKTLQNNFFLKEEVPSFDLVGQT